MTNYERRTVGDLEQQAVEQGLQYRQTLIELLQKWRWQDFPPLEMNELSLVLEHLETAFADEMKERGLSKTTWDK